MILAAERLEKVPVEQRGWEWRYLKQQTRGGLFTLRGHTTQVLGVAFSPDGERIVTGAGRGIGPSEVKLWDARTGIVVLQLNDLPEPENQSWEPQVFSLGGARLATASRDNTARVWDARTGKLQWELKHASPVIRVCLSPDGSRVVTNCPDGTVKVWDAETGKPQWEFKGTGEWTTAAFSPDGTRIFLGRLANATAKVLDARTGKFVSELTGCNDNRGLAFSPDGKRIVAGGNRVKVWDAEKGGPPLLDLGGLMQVAGSTTFSPDGTRILIGDIDGVAKVLDARTGTPLFTLKTPQASGAGTHWMTGWGSGEQSASFSPDGTRIVTVGGVRGAHVAKVWDARTGVELLALQGHTNLVFCAAFSPDGEHIITGGLDTTAKVWDARTGTPRLEMGEPGRNVNSVAFSPDGMRIVSGGGEAAKSSHSTFSDRGPGHATVWDARTGVAQVELKGLKGTTQCVAFSRDGTRIVTGGSIPFGRRMPNGEATVWDARTGAALLELKGCEQSVNSVSFSPDGTQIFTAGGGLSLPGRDLKVWDARTGAILFDLKQQGMFRGSGLDAVPRGGCVAFNSDGTRFVVGGMLSNGSSATEATVWDANTGRVLLELKGRGGAAQCAAFSPDGARIVTGGGNNRDSNRTAKVWDAATGTQLPFELKGHMGPVVSVAFSPDNQRIMTGSEDRTVRLWDARTGTTLLQLRGFRDILTSAAFSPDGTRIVTGEVGGTVTVWDTRTEKTPPTLRGHTDIVVAAGVSFSPDSTRIATGSSDRTVKVWDTRTGAILLDLKGQEGMVQSVSFSPDGGRIATGSQDRTVKVWDTRTGAVLLDLKGHEAAVGSVAFSSDGTRIVSGDGSTAKLWDARTGEALTELKGEGGSMSRVAFSRDGTRIVTVSANKAFVKVWDAGTGKELPGEAVPSALANERISPDGRLFADVAAGAAEVNLFSLKPDEEELAYRRLRTQPKLWRYRASYEEARTARDDFAARFYLKLLLELLPPAGRPALEAKAELDSLAPLSELVQEHRQAGKQDQALPLLIKIVTVKKARLGPQDPDTLNSVNELGVLYWQLRQYDKSVPVFEELVKIREVKLGRDHVGTLGAVANLGVNYRDAGRLKEAIALLEEVHRAAKKNPELLWVTGELFATYTKAGEIAKVGDLLRQEVTEARKSLPPDSPDLAGMLAQLGLNLLEQKKWDEAESIIREALTIREKTQSDAWTTFNTKSLLGGALLGQKKYADAEPLLLKGYEGMKLREKTIPPQANTRIPEAIDRLIELHTATNKPDEAKRWQAERAKYPAASKQAEKK